jgi:hypothetical protein
MLCGSGLRIVVEAGDSHYHMALRWPFGDQRRATKRAEIAKLAGRGFKAGEFFLPVGSAKMLAPHPGRAGESGGVGFLADQAMAVDDGHVQAVEPVANSPAQAAAVACLGLNHQGSSGLA